MISIQRDLMHFAVKIQIKLTTSFSVTNSTNLNENFSKIQLTSESIFFPNSEHKKVNALKIVIAVVKASNTDVPNAIIVIIIYPSIFR